MFFNRKAKNRRLEKARALEVKARARQVRIARLRLLAGALFVSVATLAGLYGLWRGGEWLLDELIFRNDAFSIRVLDIRTDGEIPIEDLHRWAGIRVHDNVFSIDLARIRRNLELESLVRQAAVERVLPDTVRIYVWERRAVARITAFQRNLEDGHFEPVTFHLDSEGYVMVPLAPRRSSLSPQETDGLPLITGVAGTELRPGSRVQSPQIHAALRLIEAFKKSPMLGLVDLQTLDLSAPQFLTAITGERSQITFAPDNLDLQISRWHAVHQHGRDQGRTIATLDLSIANNVPARWQEDQDPPARPQTLPPSNPRRKHV